MADLSLDLNPADIGMPAYRDLLRINGDFVLTQDVNPAGTNPVLQNILQRLRFFLGEWFLDNTKGVPWFQQILVKGAIPGSIDAIFQNAILGTPGVLTLLSYSSQENRADRTFHVTFTVKTASGTVSYSDNVLPVQGSVA